VKPIVSRARRVKGSQNNAPTTFAEATVNTVLWIVQVLWGVFFSVTGFGKVLCYNPARWNQALQEVPWLSAVPQDLFIFIGVCEFLGGVGLLLPAMTGVKPKLTPFGAFGLTLVMLLAAVFHIVRGEYNFVPINLVLGGIAAFIAYGRLFVRPIAPASISTFHVLKGLAVLGALVLVDFAPVWYKLTHTR
jgi:uncharacterized membrane protein YphA (DoxX/SURF4 family)